MPGQTFSKADNDFPPQAARDVHRIQSYFEIQQVNVSAAGFFLLFYALEEEKIRWKELVCGYGLDQNHAIETAQRNLDGYNNGNLTALQTAKEALEDAEAAMVAAQEVYNDALDALNKMIAAMAAEVAE